jgi:two-component system, NarL family, nitrate/nitrite response regulator NarL
VDVVSAPRVLIADDHDATRAVVRQALEDDGFHVCAEVSDADSAVQATRETKPLAALLDVRMPGNGIRAAESIHREFPAVAVVMLTVSAEDADLFAALAAGASGYWLKGQDPSSIPALIHRVLADEAVLPGALVRRLVDEWRTHDVRHRSQPELLSGVHLSVREREVIELLAEGLTTAEIAHRLFIAQATVRSHVANIAHKLRVKDRVDIVRRLRPAPNDSEDEAT